MEAKSRMETKCRRDAALPGRQSSKRQMNRQTSSSSCITAVQQRQAGVPGAAAPQGEKAMADHNRRRRVERLNGTGTQVQLANNVAPVIFKTSRGPTTCKPPVHRRRHPATSVTSRRHTAPSATVSQRLPRPQQARVLYAAPVTRDTRRERDVASGVSPAALMQPIRHPTPLQDQLVTATSNAVTRFLQDTSTPYSVPSSHNVSDAENEALAKPDPISSCNFLSSVTKVTTFDPTSKPRTPSTSLSSSTTPTNDSKMTSRNVKFNRTKIMKKKDDYSDSRTSMAKDLREDEYDAIGRTYACKLRSLNSNQRIYAEKLISEVFFEAQLNCLSRGSKVICKSSEIQMTASQISGHHSITEDTKLSLTTVQCPKTGYQVLHTSSEKSTSPFVKSAFEANI